MKITYPETGIYEHERKAIDKIKKVFDVAPKAKTGEHMLVLFMHTSERKWWKRCSQVRICLLIITHANILIIELKDWNGKKITKNAKWYLDVQKIYPVEKNKKKMFVLLNKLQAKD
jgi:hypothetical protein